MLPRFFVENWQLHQLNRVVKIAAEHIPFYSEYYAKNRIGSVMLQKLDDIQKFPITNKAPFRQYATEMLVNEAFPPNRFIWTETSGTTGEPFRFPASHLDFLTGNPGYARMYRFLIWRGFSTAHARDGAKVIQVGIKPSMTRKNYQFIPISEVIRGGNTAEVLRKIRAEKPDIVASMASLLIEFARSASEIRIEERPRFTFALYYGEPLSTYQREFIERIFSCEVYGLYGAEEAGTIGVECGAHDGFHICNESLLVEVIDQNGNPVPQGVDGRIIITTFFNDVMPFIRYELGDRGEILNGPCSCGQPSARVRIAGRNDGIFLTLGRQKFNHIEFMTTLSHFNRAILRYQVAKVSEDALEIRIIPLGSFSSEAERLIIETFHRKFGVVPRLKIVDHISYEPRGKTRVIADEAANTVGTA